MSEIRYDFLSGDYVIVAPERLNRPKYYNSMICPFCNKKYLEKIIYEKNGVMVVANKFNALTIEENLSFFTDKVIEKISGFGVHEVIIDTKRHIRSFDLNEREIENYLVAIKDRIMDLDKDNRLHYFSVFKNDGVEAGATQFHAHTQLMALPVVPKTKIDYFNKCLKFFNENGYNVFEFLMKNEKNILIEDDDFFVYNPYASRESFEIKIISKKVASLEEIDNFKILSKILYLLNNALKNVLGEFDYNLVFDLPVRKRVFYLDEFYEKKDKVFRFNISIYPRLYKIAGFEMQSGSRINVISPEMANKELKRFL